MTKLVINNIIDLLGRGGGGGGGFVIADGYIYMWEYQPKNSVSYTAGLCASTSFVKSCRIKLYKALGFLFIAQKLGFIFQIFFDTVFTQKPKQNHTKLCMGSEWESCQRRFEKYNPVVEH